MAEFQHEQLGRVNITVRTNSRRVSARWKSGIVNLNVPTGVTLPDIHRILDDLTPRLLARRPDVRFYPGERLTFPGAEIVIRQQSFLPAKIIAKASLPVSAVEVGTDFDFNDPATHLAISEMLCKIARKIAPQVILPRARELAARVGRTPVGWTISAGHRILGQCSSRGIISLSYVLMFLPTRLSDYVIYHELAHLSEMNHSERFHRLLNSYLEGREEALVKELHSYRWPVFRK